ncbi:response regulator [Streptoverticillium reticulum]|uniref:response regulator transcription factor n=1 Tax=Streptoverticillium reticulum TaxID=1433415 RepID=UPI0039BFD5E2
MIRVLIVDDQPVIRTGLRTLLAMAEDLTIVGEAGDGAEAVSVTRELEPDVVLMDLDMPNVGGIDATLQLLRIVHPPKVIILTTFNTNDAVLGALEAGASGFLLKTATPQELTSSIRSVASGASVLSFDVLRRVTSRSAARTPVRVRDLNRKLALLRETELKVLALVGGGLANQEIAKALNLSLTSVKTYVSRILNTLGMNNRTQAAILAYDLGFASSDPATIDIELPAADEGDPPQ